MKNKNEDYMIMLLTNRKNRLLQSKSTAEQEGNIFLIDEIESEIDDIDKSIKKLEK